VPRPKISWLLLVLIGMTLFTGQFLLLFFAYTQGMPPGLASVTQQMQAFFTVLLAAVFLRNIPNLRQCLGMTIAFTGLALIGLTGGSDLKLTVLGLALAGACSWAVDNVVVKRTSNVPRFPWVVWCSFVPPLPAMIVSSADDQGLANSHRSSHQGAVTTDRYTVVDSLGCQGLCHLCQAMLSASRRDNV
jgi:O-acetylserine/cysteine efflux transporter